MFTKSGIGINLTSNSCISYMQWYFRITNKKIENNKYMENDVSKNNNSGKAVAGFVLGLCGAIFWLLPLLGLPITITGLILSVKAKDSARRGLAKAGLILNIIFLVISIINASIGAYMGATGRL